MQGRSFPQTGPATQLSAPLKAMQRILLAAAAAPVEVDEDGVEALQRCKQLRNTVVRLNLHAA